MGNIKLEVIEIRCFKNQFDIKVKLLIRVSKLFLVQTNRIKQIFYRWSNVVIRVQQLMNERGETDFSCLFFSIMYMYLNGPFLGNQRVICLY